MEEKETKVIIFRSYIASYCTQRKANSGHHCGCLFQTAVAVGEELEDKLPHNEYYEYFGPDYTLHVTASNMANQNSRKELDALRCATNFIFLGLRMLDVYVILSLGS